ncbi:olfactory receptor 51G2-like [Pleurodeles waltl]|uniref:olfactory receptor 51G2-like n=1 Tax=Pleurodeles waltl TaxID=8319 RepID=UPI00370983A4
MFTFNVSSSKHPSFLLMGFPGEDSAKTWMSLLLCFLFLASILGNGLILLITRTDKRFTEPMYLLLSMLAATDLGMTLSTFPTVLSVFCLDIRNINFYSCLIQLFCIHSLCSIESALLVAMAFDRLVAICNPLRYNSVLQPVVDRLGMVAVIRGVCIHFPIPFLLNRLSYCANTTLSHGFCYHPDVMKLACEDTTINSTYGLVLVLATYLLDSVFIVLSYGMILKTVLGSSAQAGPLKALHTCGSHLCVVLLFYIPLIGLTLAHRYGRNASPLLLVMMGLVFLVVPSSLNPIVYSIKNKQIRNVISQRIWTEGCRK